MLPAGSWARGTYLCLLRPHPGCALPPTRSCVPRQLCAEHGAQPGGAARAASRHAGGPLGCSCRMLCPNRRWCCCRCRRLLLSASLAYLGSAAPALCCTRYRPSVKACTSLLPLPCALLASLPLQPVGAERTVRYGAGSIVGELDFFLQRPCRWVQVGPLCARCLLLAVGVVWPVMARARSS